MSNVVVHKPDAEKTHIETYAERCQRELEKLYQFIRASKPMTARDAESYTIGTLAGIIIQLKQQAIDDSQRSEEVKSYLKDQITELKEDIKELRERTR